MRHKAHPVVAEAEGQGLEASAVLQCAEGRGSGWPDSRPFQVQLQRLEGPGTVQGG